MTGRHRGPPMLARWFSHIAVVTAVGIVGPPVWLFAATIGAEASAASAAAGRHGVTVSTAVRSARTVHVPLTVLPVPVPVIGAEAEARRSAPRGRVEAVSTGTRSAQNTPEAVSEPLVATTDPLATEQQSATQPDTDEDPPPSPTTDTAAEPDEDSSDPTTTEETTVTPEPTAEPTPTDIGDVIDEVLGTEMGTP